MDKFETYRKWSVLDARQDPQAEVYEFALIDNGKALSFVRFILEPRDPKSKLCDPPKVDHIITILPYGKMSRAGTESFAEDHIAYMEAHFCFCLEFRGKVKT